MTKKETLCKSILVDQRVALLTIHKSNVGMNLFFHRYPDENYGKHISWSAMLVF